MNEQVRKDDDYLVRPRQAHLVLVLLFLLMLFDFIDRQVLSALLPTIKVEWSLSDTQLGALVSIVNIAIAVLALPTAVIVDRWSRTRSIGVMALIWSVATAACAFSGSFVQLLVARFLVGAGEAGYSAGGNSLLAALYPKRLRATVIGIFQSASMLGSVVGVVLGGYIAARWGWRHAFGIVAVPGLFLAVMVFFVRDYKTVRVTIKDQASGMMRDQGVMEMLLKIFRSPVLCLIFIGQASQMLFVSTLGNWMPSYFNREFGLSLSQAGLRSGLVILVGALGVACCGYAIDKLARGQSHRRLFGAAGISASTALLFGLAFGGSGGTSMELIFAGAFFMTAVLGPVMSAVIDYVHPGARTSTTGALITATNLLGMGVGPTLAGMLSDRYDLGTALQMLACAPVLAAVCYVAAALKYRRAAVEGAVKVAGGLA